MTKPKCTKRAWAAEEDAQLITAVMREGPHNWSSIARSLKDRKDKQCRERWFNHLCPQVKKGDWTPEEDRIILASIAELGTSWSQIAKRLPGRTDHAIKNRYYSATRRQKQVGGPAGGPTGTKLGGEDLESIAAAAIVAIPSNGIPSNGLDGPARVAAPGAPHVQPMGAPFMAVVAPPAGVPPAAVPALLPVSQSLYAPPPPGLAGQVHAAAARTLPAAVQPLALSAPLASGAAPLLLSQPYVAPPAVPATGGLDGLTAAPVAPPFPPAFPDFSQVQATGGLLPAALPTAALPVSALDPLGVPRLPFSVPAGAGYAGTPTCTMASPACPCPHTGALPSCSAAPTAPFDSRQLASRVAAAPARQFPGGYLGSAAGGGAGAPPQALPPLQASVPAAMLPVPFGGPAPMQQAFAHSSGLVPTHAAPMAPHAPAAVPAPYAAPPFAPAAQPHLPLPPQGMQGLLPPPPQGTPQPPPHAHCYATSAADKSTMQSQQGALGAGGAAPALPHMVWADGAAHLANGGLPPGSAPGAGELQAKLSAVASQAVDVLIVPAGTSRLYTRAVAEGAACGSADGESAPLAYGAELHCGAGLVPAHSLAGPAAQARLVLAGRPAGVPKADEVNAPPADEARAHALSLATQLLVCGAASGHDAGAADAFNSVLAQLRACQPVSSAGMMSGLGGGGLEAASALIDRAAIADGRGALAPRTRLLMMAAPAAAPDVDGSHPEGAALTRAAGGKGGGRHGGRKLAHPRQAAAPEADDITARAKRANKRKHG